MALPRRAVLLGGAGQLGTEIRRAWSGVEFSVPTRAELDITDRTATAAFIERAGAGAVINCAAFHNVEQCEREPEKAFEANALAVDAMARAAAAAGSAFMTVSTDYVFDGALGRPYRESDAPAPLNAYGVSKLAGELLVARLQSEAYVVRTCGVYGIRPSTAKGYTFVDRVINQKRAGEPVRIVADQTVSPTFASDLADGMRALFERDAPAGLYHIVNDGAVTWYDYARAALRGAGLDDGIEAISYKEWQTTVRRPAFSALENSRLRELGIAMPSWESGLSRYLNMLMQQRAVDNAVHDR
ncbi:MAG TPA: dTDP-4-dehydrorhamnose reductase [Candidatus Baltobacteraceae bacterium]|nr:dTDP-4-dehydrorhamnose reductase [Candidatus Baltobacteraceae bacterium]